jgi:hypothetical protein
MAKTKKLGKLTNKAIKIAQDRCKLGYFDVEGEEFVRLHDQRNWIEIMEENKTYFAPTANPDFANALNLKAIHRKAVLKQIQVMINDNPIMDYECPDCNLEAIEVPATKNGYSKIRIINFLQKQGLIKKEVIHYIKTVGVRLTLRSKASQPQLTWLKRDYKSIMQVIDAFVAGYNSQASLLTQISLNEREFLVHKSVLEEKNAKVAEITREIETEFAYGSQGNNDKIARLLVSLQDIENN